MPSTSHLLCTRYLFAFPLLLPLLCPAAAAPGAAGAADGQACAPAWPAGATGRGESGRTSVLLRVGPDGQVVNTKLSASSGFRDLDEATIAAARKCTFAPKLRGGVPIATSVAYTHVWKRSSSPLGTGSSAPAARKPCAPLDYPAASLANGEHGTVNMTFLIDADGAVREKNLVGTSGYPELDRAALDGMAQCSFTPAITNGKPETSLLSFSYTWTLH